MFCLIVASEGKEQSGRQSLSHVCSSTVLGSVLCMWMVPTRERRSTHCCLVVDRSTTSDPGNGDPQRTKDLQKKNQNEINNSSASFNKGRHKLFIKITMNSTSIHPTFYTFHVCPNIAAQKTQQWLQVWVRYGLYFFLSLSNILQAVCNDELAVFL